MPSQLAEIVGAISGLRRARDRELRASSGQPINSATNRGKKTYRGANDIHTGALAYTFRPDRYREKVEHAGYTRYILERIPKRYDKNYNELDYDESDEEADAEAADGNPYSGIQIEELLCPLKHPSELATHPALSVPYLDSALPDMVKTTEEKLQRERANLWRAKNLNRQFIGDRSWMPCSTVESLEDWDMFEPRPRPVEGQGLKRRRRDSGAGEPENVDSLGNNASVRNRQADDAEQLQNGTGMEQSEDVGVEGDDLTVPGQNGVSPEDGPPAAEAVDVEMDNADESRAYGNELDKEVAAMEKEGEESASNTGAGELTPQIDGEDGEKSSEAASPPPPSRRITRALAATNNPNAPSPPLSPTPTLTDASSSSLYQIDPLFLLPSHTMSNRANGSQAAVAASGLPIEEAVETRKLLTMYIQKQEESVRGYEAVLAKLIKAKRLREGVLEMCKADGHVGEMSDGEDWIDSQQWGLAPAELRKGRDEDDEGGEEREVTGIGGRKGKRRRN